MLVQMYIVVVLSILVNAILTFVLSIIVSFHDRYLNKLHYV